MIRRLPVLLAALALAAAAAARAQPIEDELVVITPVGKSLSDPALAEFRAYARQRWNVSVRASAMSAGTPLAYGRIVESAGRPQADLFRGGESALFDRLAAQKLLQPLGLPPAVTDAIPPSLGRPKPVSLKDPNGFWVGTLLESCGIVYHPRLLARLGVPPPRDWDDLRSAGNGSGALRETPDSMRRAAATYPRSWRAASSAPAAILAGARPPGRHARSSSSCFLSAASASPWSGGCSRSCRRTACRGAGIDGRAGGRVQRRHTAPRSRAGFDL